MTTHKLETIQVREVFGPAVGTRVINYKGYFINDTDFVALRKDGTLQLRRLSVAGSKLLEIEYKESA